MQTVVVQEADATEHLMGRRRDAAGRLAGDHLGASGQGAGRLSPIDASRGVEGRELRGIRIHRHVRAMMLDRLEGADRLPELLAPARVGDRVIERGPGRARELGTDEDRRPGYVVGRVVLAMG